VPENPEPRIPNPGSGIPPAVPRGGTASRVEGIAVTAASALWIAFLAVWAATQLHYGAVAPWAVAASAAALAALNLAAMVLLPGGLALSRMTVAFLAGTAAIFAMQFLPLGFLVPATSALRASHGIVGAWPATADAFLTLRCLVQFFVYVLTALLVLKLRDGGVSGTTMMKGVCAVLVVQALYGLLQKFACLTEIPFYGPRGGSDAASGTFVNRNTFAGVMAIGIVAAAALAYSRFASRPREAGVAWAGVTALFIAGLILSGSRGGALGAGIGLVLLPLLHRGRSSLTGAAAILVAGGAGMLLADPTVLVDRFNELDPQEIRENGRWQIWTSTASAGLHQPLLGFGVGSHPHAYHPYQPTFLVGQVHHAHNEYVNFFFEGGIAWLGILVAGFGVWAARTWKAGQRLMGPDRMLPAAAIAAACAEAVHSLVDFDLRVTSAGMMFAVMIGLGGAVQRSRRAPSRWVPGLSVFVAAVAALALFLAPLNSEPRVDEAARSDPGLAAKRCLEALSLSPYNFRAAWILAKSTDDAKRFAVAADLWPAHPGLQQDVGLWFWDHGDAARAALCLHRLFEQRPSEVAGVMQSIWRKDRPLADYQALLPTTPAAAGAFAGFLVGKGKWREGMELFEKGCPEVPANAAVFDAFATQLEADGQWGMAAAVRDRRVGIKSDPAAHAAAARAWGRLEAWDRAQEQALLARRTDPSRVEWVLLSGDLHRAAHELEKALEAFVEAARLAPAEPGPLQKRASLYGEMKLYSSAVDDYRRLLQLHPGDREASLGLVQSLVPMGDRSGARRALEELLRRHPGDADAVRLLESLK
jgi:tetratricopeptide (TPR) repeat protein